MRSLKNSCVNTVSYSSPARLISAQDNCNMARPVEKKDKATEFKTEQTEKLQGAFPYLFMSVCRELTMSLCRTAAYLRQLKDSEAHTQKIRELTRDLVGVRAELEELSQWKADHADVVETAAQAKRDLEEHQAALKGVPLSTAAEMLEKFAKIVERAGQPPDP